jgi:dienelactone hydrolase
MRFGNLMGVAASVVVLLGNVALAEIRNQTIEYRDGPTVLEGYLAYDDATEDLRPGVLIAPEWWGLDDYPKHRAQQLARMGYVAFAIDMYGSGNVTNDPQQAGKWMTPFATDRMLTRRRAQAGLDVLLGQKYVDPKRVGGIGYCFGGMVVLELARAGAPLNGVVSFHGNLTRTADEGADKIAAKVLICQGGDDPLAPVTVLPSFMDEMKLANANFQVNVYSGAQHAFTNPASDTRHIPGIAYNAQADKRSWMAMDDFFAEIFRQQ